MRSTMGFLMAMAATAAAATSFSPASAATIGGTYYAPQYDFQDFWTASDGKYFRVTLAGNPFPALPPRASRCRPATRDAGAKPRPALRFTYDAPVEEPRPDYRLVLVSNAANDLNGDSVCKGTTRFKPGAAGVVNLFAVYCRNDMVMSMTTATTPAATPNDPNVSLLFRELFMVVFSDLARGAPQRGWLLSPLRAAADRPFPGLFPFPGRGWMRGYTTSNPAP